MLGDRVGAYRLLSKLGEGGMGVVYVAEHVELGQRVAVKLLLPELSQDQEIVQRFFNEARAATRIKHPGIVQVMDFGRHASGAAYFAMELLEGESLSARLRRVGMLGVQQVALLGRQACNALAAAHGQGIVHRDLKPDNLMLVPDPDVVGGERVKILDFGIAKLAAEAQGVSLKTKTGSVMGTPYYMSPEQCRGAGEVDWRSDIYSMGCILYEMACGRPPFSGEGLGEVLGQHQFVAPTSPRQRAPHITPTLEAIIMRALAKEAGARQQSMQELGNELSALAGAGPFSAQQGVQGGPRITAPEPAPPSIQMPTPTPMPGPAPLQRSHPSAPTTLGGSAGQRAGESAGARSRAPLFALLGLVVVGGAATTYFVTRGGDGKGSGAGSGSAAGTSVSSAAAPGSGPVALPSPPAAAGPGVAAPAAPRASADLEQARAAIAAEKWSDALASAVQALRQDPGSAEARALQAQAERELRAQVVFENLSKRASSKDWQGVLETNLDLDPASVYHAKAAPSVAEARRAILASTLKELGKLNRGHKCSEARTAAERARVLLPDDGAALDKAIAGCSTSDLDEGRMGKKDSQPEPSTRPAPGQPDEVACLLNPDLAGCRKRIPSRTPPVEPAGQQGLTGAQIREGVSAVRGRVQQCAAKFSATGTVKVKLVIAPSGDVRSASVVGDLAGTPAGACIATAVMQADFPAFAGPPMSVSYPFVLN